MSITLASNAAILAAQAILVVIWLRDRPVRDKVVYGVVVSLGVALVVAAAIGTSSEAILGNFTLLHEGNSSRAIHALYGWTHVGDNLKELWAAIPGAGLPIEGVVRLNMAFTKATTCVLLLVAYSWLRLKPVWLVVFAIVCLKTSPFDEMLSSSELPSAALGFYSSMMILPFVLTRNGRLMTRLSAAGTLCLASFLLFVSRPEMLLLAAPVAAMGLLNAFDVRKPTELLNAACRRIFAFAQRHPVVCIVLVVVPEYYLWQAIPEASTERLRWAMSALDPFRPTILSAPGAIARWLPPTAVLLVLLGWWYCLRRWDRSAALAIFIVPMYRLYLAASHTNDLELLRYLSHLWVPIILFALAGVIQLRTAMEGWGWSRQSSRLLVVALALGLLPIQPGGIMVGRLRPGNQLFVENQAAQFLASSLYQHPDCNVVAGVRDIRSEERFLVFSLLHAPQPFSEYDEALRHQFEGSETKCTLFYRSLSCGLADGVECPRPSGEVIASETVTGQRYSDVGEYGALPAVSLLELIRLDPEDSSDL